MSPPWHQHRTKTHVIKNVMCHITCHTSHVTNVTNNWKIYLDTLCDAILEMSPPQHIQGTKTHVIKNVMCHITHHKSYIICHKCHKSMENSTDTFCDTILEMSLHQNQNGTLILHHMANHTPHDTCHISQNVTNQRKNWKTLNF